MNNKKFELANENSVAQMDLDALKQKQEEGELLRENLMKKNNFFKNNIQKLNDLIQQKEKEKLLVFFLFIYIIIFLVRKRKGKSYKCY